MLLQKSPNLSSKKRKMQNFEKITGQKVIVLGKVTKFGALACVLKKS